MSLNLPEHASCEYLKKLAKERLALLRARPPATKLADAQLALARDYVLELARTEGRNGSPTRAERRRIQGGDPIARDVGDNATPLHFAAANGALDSVRLLLDAGADVHSTGDLPNGGVIGWAARAGNDVKSCWNETIRSGSLL